MKNIFLALLTVAMLAISSVAVAQNDESAALAGLFDNWGDNITKLRNERLGDFLAFSGPESPDKESLYWAVKTEEDVAVINDYIDRFHQQLYKPVRFPDIDPLKEATPMHIAALFNGNPEVLQAMADGGGDVNVTENDNRVSPLHAALYANRPLAIIKKLVELGADVNAKLDGGDYSGMIPLHLAAAFSDQQEVIDYLVKKGADIRATFKYGSFKVTPLDALKHKGVKSMQQNPRVLALLEHYSDSSTTQICDDGREARSSGCYECWDDSTAKSRSSCPSKPPQKANYCCTQIGKFNDDSPGVKCEGSGLLMNTPCRCQDINPYSQRYGQSVDGEGCG